MWLHMNILKCGVCQKTTGIDVKTTCDGLGAIDIKLKDMNDDWLGIESNLLNSDNELLATNSDWLDSDNEFMDSDIRFDGVWH